MATKYAKGEVVKLNMVVPQGPIEKLRMDEDGNVFYLIGWIDINGSTQERWFAEQELVKA